MIKFTIVITPLQLCRITGISRLLLHGLLQSRESDLTITELNYMVICVYMHMCHSISLTCINVYLFSSFLLLFLAIFTMI